MQLYDNTELNEIRKEVNNFAGKFDFPYDDLTKE